jgi:hypothetical protein
MKARVRIIVAALALPVFGGPLLAQEAPPPPQNDVVGNPQLQDFSLNGTVTQPSTAPAPVQQQPQSRPPATTTSGQAQPPRQAEPQSSASVRESARQPAPSRESASSDVDRTSRPEDTATTALSNPIYTGPIAPSS